MTFIADTNVVSEIFRPKPDPRVVRWFRENDPEICISWVTVAELRQGVALENDPNRRRKLAAWVDRVVEDYFDPAAMNLTDGTARCFGELVARRKAAGRSKAWPDTVIASIAQDFSLTVATRNTSDFPDVPTVNPWNEKAAGDDADGLED
jgi:toxin FitB